MTDCPGVLAARRQGRPGLAVLQPCEALSINTVTN